MRIWALLALWYAAFSLGQVQPPWKGAPNDMLCDCAFHAAGQALLSAAQQIVLT